MMAIATPPASSSTTTTTTTTTSTTEAPAVPSATGPLDSTASNTVSLNTMQKEQQSAVEKEPHESVSRPMNLQPESGIMHNHNHSQQKQCADRGHANDASGKDDAGSYNNEEGHTTSLASSSLGTDKISSTSTQSTSTSTTNTSETKETETGESLGNHDHDMDKATKPTESELKPSSTLSNLITSTQGTTTTTIQHQTPSHSSNANVLTTEHLKTSSKPTATKDHSSTPKSVLPPELRRILYEVAQTGLCSSLPWSSSSSMKTLPTSSALNYASLVAKRLRQKKLSNHSCTAGGNRGKKRIRKDSNKLKHVSSTSSTATTPTRNGLNGIIHSNQTFPASTSNANTNANTTTKSATTTSNPEGMKPTATIQDKAHDPISPQVFLSEGEGENSNSNQSHPQLERKKRGREYPCGSSSCCSGSVSSVGGGGSVISAPSSTTSTNRFCQSFPYRTLRDAVRVAVELVLDHSYTTCGGYRPSPAERRKFERQLQNLNKSASVNTAGMNSSAGSTAMNATGVLSMPNIAKIAFTERQKDLLNMLQGPPCNTNDGFTKTTTAPLSTSTSMSDITTVLTDEVAASSAGGGSVNAANKSMGNATSTTSNLQSLGFHNAEMAKKKMKREVIETPAATLDDPPFTIQRVAEVLLTPEKYYTQTHKLCNAIEKLLLVTATSDTFGGVTGGDTSQSRREEREIAALADEKGREETELRQRRLKRRQSTTLSDCSDPVLQMNVSVEEPTNKRIINNSHCVNEHLAGDGFSTDHPTHTPNPLLGTLASSKSMTETTEELSGTTHSTMYRENFSNTGGASANRSSFPPLHIGTSTSSDIPQTLHTEVNRPPSPILFNSGSAAALDPLMNGHHTSSGANHLHASAVAASASAPAGLEGAVGNRMQMEIVIDPAAAAAGANPSRGDLAVASYLEQVKGGFSSASDIESESDDLSFDDSASDRSDGSDCGSLSEPFTAARVMALNRMQQQHRREQYLQSTRASSGQQSAGTANSGASGNTGANFLMDSEYQSGDSIDSTMAEDSCGSDSSSSDLAD